MRLYHTELEDPRTYRIERTRELLGKAVSVVLGTHNTADITLFSGVITEVAFEEKTGLYGEMILRGASPTILLEGGAHYGSFLDKNLASIAEDVLAPVRGHLETGVGPRFTGNIEYTVQHGESHFAFLNRLASLHGEWFLYDGERVHFGRPARGAEYKLQYARHIESLQMAMRAAPVSFETIGYRAAEEQNLSQKAPERVQGLNFYAGTAVEKSNSIYPEAARHYSTLHAPDQGKHTRSTGVAKAVIAADTFSVRGTSRHPAPRPGLRLRVMMSGSEMGEYLVTKATHKLDNVNNYSCAFEALGADLEVLPVQEHIVLPRAEAQVATVTGNADPAGQGRVQVQMQWRGEDSTTPWIRVMTPDAGSSGVVSKNRGYVFIPEVGDQVMVGFENGNPDAPFVLGSLFHGSNLIETSKAICSVGGSPCIKINFHGQTASVSSAQTDAAAPAMAVLNPLAPKPVAEGKEAPKVKKISLALTGRTKPETVPSKEKGGVATAKVRVDESLKFEVTEYWNKAKADPAKVSWKIVAAHAFEGEQTLHSEIGPVLEIKLDKPGKYRVLPYGEKVRMHVQTMNLAGQKVHASIYLNLAQGEDKPVLQDKEFTVAADETLKIDIDTGQFKSQIAVADRKEVAMFYVVLKEADGDKFVYPQDLSLAQTLDLKKVNFYHHLKLSEAPDEVNQRAAANAPAVIGEPLDDIAAAGLCQCKLADLIWGSKVDCAFRKKVVEIAADLWGEEHKLEMANNLMAVFEWESGGTFRADVPNRANSGGTGLIQFMPPTAEQLLGKPVTIEHVKNYFGQMYSRKEKRKVDQTLKRVKEFADMTPVRQLDYVKKYFEPLRGKRMEFVDFYLQVLFPASSRKEDHIVFASTLAKLTTRPEESAKLKQLRVTAYEQNSGLDVNRDGQVWKSEVKISVQKYVLLGEGYKAKKFECNKEVPAPKTEGSIGPWHHPVDNPQLRGWYAKWAPERSIHSSNIPGRSKGKHDGLDLYAPVDTQVYACLDGEVHEIYVSESYGNVINIKGEYNGKEYWFFYAHLSKVSISAKDAAGNPTKVSAGQKIGKSGKTGSSAAGLRPNQVHLHFEVRTTPARVGGRVDPFTAIDELNEGVNKQPRPQDQP